MTPSLPPTLATYFAAKNRHDTAALLACFSPDATVRDEGQDITGLPAIRAWIESTSARYAVQAEPLDCREEAGRSLVRARLSGTFPGSPAVLTFRFGLGRDGLIDALEIG
ncbi:nuclear transport factor 2 family protein [Roseomonas sp. F4]